MVTIGTFPFNYYYQGVERSATVSKFYYDGHIYYDLKFPTGNCRLTRKKGGWVVHLGKNLKPELLRALGNGIAAYDKF